MKSWSFVTGCRGRLSGGRRTSDRATPGRTLTWLAILALAVQTASLASAAPARQVLRKNIPSVVASLAPLRQYAATNQMHLAIGLPLRNTQALTNLLRQIYDPASPDYRQYLTPAQFAERFGPSEQDYQAVIQFARAHGLTVTRTYSNRLVVDVSGSAGKVERALHVTLRVYQHPTEHRTFYACDTEPSLDLSVPVQHITGLDNYRIPRPALRAVPIAGLTNAPASLEGGISPAALTGSGPLGLYMGEDFRAAYTPQVPLYGAGQRVALFELDGFYPVDIATYASLAGIPQVPVQEIRLDGFTGPTTANGVVEVSLDIEMAMALAPGLSQILVYEAPNGYPSFITDLLNRIANDDLAKQISSSWLLYDNPTWDAIYLQYAAQGQSFFQASGDDGAFNWYAQGQQRTDNPYVTLVGGTTLTTLGPGGPWSSEVVWPYSGGGISPTYAIPSWQLGVNMSGNGGSTVYRNIPDVAMIADEILVVANEGYGYAVGGTSAAAPLWAAFTALANEKAVDQGNPTLGFLNPTIYAIGTGPVSSYASGFHDIVSGNNTNVFSPDQFFAAPGYDLCTGWGTPDGLNTINALLGSVPSGLLGLSVNPPNGAALLASSLQTIQVTVSDALAITNATVTATIPGVTNLTFLDDGQPPDAAAGDGVYSATLAVPAATGSITMTVMATATNEIGKTNVLTYQVVSPPPNDDFENAIKVPAAGASYLENNQDATLQVGEPIHAGDSGVAASLWWDWTPASNTNVFLDTTGSAINTVVAVYTGPTLSSLVPVASDAAGFFGQAHLNVDVTGGTTYHIAVASASSGSLGSLRFVVAPGGLPDTNTPTALVTAPLSGLWLSNRTVVVTGTANDPQPNASGLKRVVVGVNSRWRFTADGTTNWSCLVALNRGLNNLQVTAQDEAGNVSVPVSLQLTYVPPPSPDNDLFVNAIALTNDAGLVSADTTNATKELGEPYHAGNAGGKSVWWSFQPPADGLLRLSTSNSTFDTLLGVYTGTNVAHLTTIASDDDAYSGVPGGYSLLDMAVRSNQTYYIAVDGYGGAYGTANLGYSFAAAPVYRLTVSNAPGGAVLVTTTNSQGGTQVMPGTSGDFTLNSTATLTAIPHAFFSFDHWDGSLTSTHNPLSVTITNDLNLTGYFAPTPFTDGFESGTLSHLGWTTGGDVPWLVQTNVVAAGEYAARSGVIGDSQSSSLILTTNFAAGTGSFDFRVSSETNFDVFEFYVDDIRFHQWSGDVGWANYVFPLTAGTHTLEWRYTKDPSLSAGLDAAFIDNVNLPISVGSLAPAQLQMVDQGDGVYAIHLVGQTNQQYVLQTSTNLLDWQSIATNTATDGTILFPYPGSLSDSTHFYRAVAAPP